MPSMQEIHLLTLRMANMILCNEPPQVYVRALENLYILFVPSGTYYSIHFSVLIRILSHYSIRILKRLAGIAVFPMA